MRSWLLLVLVIAGHIVVVGLMAAACTGRWRTLWEAMRQFTAYLLLLALPAALVGLGILLLR